MKELEGEEETEWIELEFEEEKPQYVVDHEERRNEADLVNLEYDLKYRHQNEGDLFQ